MEINNLEKILDVLNNALKNVKYQEDLTMLKKIYTELNDFNFNNIQMEKLDMIKNDIEYLEDKYNHDLELSYYYDPLYISATNILHSNYVQKIREENRRKREKK